ncbi:MAG: protein kinase [Anaerolineales bacterium]
MPFQQGENVGPYRIIEQLGQGGMATVFKAYHPNLDRYVAIKVLHPAFRQDPQFLERFGREARVVAILDHPNIVPVFDYADHNGQSYLVMKFIEGETLKAVIDRQWPSKEQILGIVRSVGNALTYAHSKGVLHRDVKPSNILLAEPGNVYLADFGLARMAEAGESTLSGDQLLGTPHYISPEQARGEKILDAGTDIYSFGIVLYQLAVGRVPYNSDTPFSIIHDHIYTPLPMPRSINEKIPEDLERVLLKALAKDRADRFASVQELVEAFDDAARGISPWDEDAAAAAPIALAAAAASDPIAELAGSEAGDPNPELIAESAGTAEAADPIAVPAGTMEAADPIAGPAGATGAGDPIAGPVAELKPKPRPRRWAWVGGGLAFALLSLVTFGFAMSGSGAGPTREQPEYAAGEQVPQNSFEGSHQGEFDGVPQGAIEGFPQREIDGVPEGAIEGSPQGSIPSAWQLVNNDPNNPEAHLELAKALAIEGDMVPAKSEFTKASELYIEQANYVSAAESLVTGLELTGANPGDDLRISNILSQALFLGAESGGMFPAIEALYEISPEWSPLEALYARSRLYVGETEVAAGMLDRILNTAPEDILANAVMIDVLHQSGDNEQALQLTNKLLQRPRTPPWLGEHLHGYQAVLSS